MLTPRCQATFKVSFFRGMCGICDEECVVSRRLLSQVWKGNTSERRRSALPPLHVTVEQAGLPTDSDPRVAIHMTLEAVIVWLEIMAMRRTTV